MGVKTENAAVAAVESPQCLTANLSWLLSQASFTLQTELTAALERLFVSPRAHCVLATAMTGNHTQTELAHLIGLDKTTMVVTLDELEAAGLAKRQPSPEDRRARVVVVTEAGKRKVAEAAEIVDQTHADVLDSLPADERKVFMDALARLVTNRLSKPVACTSPVRRRAARA